MPDGQSGTMAGDAPAGEFAPAAPPLYKCLHDSTLSAEHISAHTAAGPTRLTLALSGYNTAISAALH